MSAFTATTSDGVVAPQTSKSAKHNSTNHSRPYTFESRRGPHYYPHRASSPPLLPTGATTTAASTPTLPTTGGGSGLMSSSESTTSSSRTRSPPLHPDEIFQPPSLGEKSKHMYNSGAAPQLTHPPNAYADPHMFNYNPAVEPQIFGWNAEGGLVDYSLPGYIDLVEHRQRKILSRSRLILRVLATLCSICIVAGLGSAIAVYFNTRNNNPMWNGQPIWHASLDQTPSTTLLATGGGLTLVSFAMLSMSAWARIRHVTLLSNLLNIGISLFNICVAIFGAAFFVYYRGTPEEPTFWHWVCAHGVDDEQVQFGMLCREATFSYGMAYVVAVVEVLVLVNIVVGWVMLGKNGGRSRGVGRTVVVQVKKAEKKQGLWKESY